MCVHCRVLDILTYWMKKCWPDVYRHPPVVSPRYLLPHSYLILPTPTERESLQFFNTFGTGHYREVASLL